MREQNFDNFNDTAVQVSSNINLILTLDHGGRGGSNYFQCLFDKHQTLIMCPLVHYVYSYWQLYFGDEDNVSSDEAISFISVKSYFRLLYQPPEGDHGALITKIGGDVSAPFDRKLFREIIDQFFISKSKYSRKDIILFTMMTYAYVRGIDLKKIKYIGLNDAISTRMENPSSGYDLNILKLAKADFKDLQVLCLWRDPRAQFASTKQQLFNTFGGDFSFNAKTLYGMKTLFYIFSNKETFDTGPAFLFSILYQRSAFSSLVKKLAIENINVLHIRNEDFNLKFKPTMLAICRALEIKADDEWIVLGDHYRAYMMGVYWAGTGSYNPRYETKKKSDYANGESGKYIKDSGAK